MSSKDRVTLCLKPETVARLTLVANYRKGAKSALVEEALERYLNPERRRLLDDAALRRLETAWIASGFTLDRDALLGRVTES